MNIESNDKKEEIKKQVNNLFGVFEEVAKLNIAVCPEWKVTGVRITDESAEISICLKECNDLYMKIVCNKSGEKESFQTNVMGYGYFDLFEDSNVANYYCSAADVIQHKRMLKTLKDYMASSINIYNTFHKEFNSLESQEG